ncbi:MAG: hypothetical protein J6J23_03560 [Clostridia bacterium]|nr:hypothetical protein [Clostridia bacterium]
MDGIEILHKLKEVGYKPENSKEEEFIYNLKENGFVFFDRASNMFKLQPDTVIEDGAYDVTLTLDAKVQSLALFALNNNFRPSLERVVKNPNVQLNYLGLMEEIDWDKVLGEHKLGEYVDCVIVGYAKSPDNEAYQVELPTSIKSLQYCKNKRASNPCLTVALSKKGKERDSALLEFTPVRRAISKMRLGVKTSQGVYFSKDEISNSKLIMKINKAEFYS